MRAVFTILMLSATAHAEPGDTSATFERERAPTEELRPWTAPARHDVTGTTARTYTWIGDGDPSFGANVEATPVSRIAIHAGMERDATAAGAIVDLLREERSGVDLAVGADYTTRGWNGVPAVMARVALARSIGTARLATTVSYAGGLEQGERYGEIGAALTSHLGAIIAGMDGLVRVDLERDDAEPAGERELEVRFGPVASYPVGPFAISAGAGVTAWRMREQPMTHVGLLGLLGLAAAF